MDEQVRAELSVAVARLYGSQAKWLEEVNVVERHAGRAVWSGTVQTYRLTGHPEAELAHAWEEPPEQEGGKARVFAVLEAGPVKSAADAVRASLIQRVRERRG